MTTGKDDQQAPAEFQDPLENYEPKEYTDPLERALAEETVAAIQSTPYASVTADASIEEAVQELASLHVACLLVEEDGKLLGVFTHRTVLDRVVLEYEDIKQKPVREVMATNPVFVYETDSSAAALAVMAVVGYRHVPVLSTDEKILGIVSPQRITAFLMQHVKPDAEDSPQK